MDPRHPELAVSRIKELIKQYNRIEVDMKKATTSAQLGQLEREGGLVVQEICLVAPRIHEAMMQTSRQRRHDLAHGVLDEPQDTTVEEPKLTPEEEEDFARLLVILDNAKKQFEGKDARNKETGEVYTSLYFLTIKPFSTDNQGYGIVVSMRNGDEIISFGNEKVVDFLNGYEPVEKPVEKPAPKTGMMDEATADKILDTIEKVAPAPKKKTTRKKKTAKKVEK